MPLASLLRVAMLLLCALGCAQGAGVARAQDDSLARELKQQGDAAMERGDYEQALSLYVRASGVEPTPALHYNRGRALQALSRFADALAALEQFEAQASEQLKAMVPNLPALLESLRRHVGELSVHSNVPDATLRIDGQRTFPLPLLDLRLDARAYQLEVVREGYETHARTIVLEGGSRLDLRMDLVQRDERARLRITSEVAGAQVWIAGEARGHAPLELALDPGEYALELRHRKYHAAQTHVVLQPREERDLAVPMERKPRLYTRWWLWTAVAVVAGATVAVAKLATRTDDPTPGDIPPGVLVAPSFRVGGR